MKNEHNDAENAEKTELSDEECLNVIRKYEEQEYETRKGFPSFWKIEGDELYEICEADYYEILESVEVSRLFKYP